MIYESFCTKIEAIVDYVRVIPHKLPSFFCFIIFVLINHRRRAGIELMEVWPMIVGGRKGIPKGRWTFLCHEEFKIFTMFGKVRIRSNDISRVHLHSAGKLPQRFVVIFDNNPPYLVQSHLSMCRAFLYVYSSLRLKPMALVGILHPIRPSVIMGERVKKSAIGFLYAIPEEMPV